MSGEHPSVSMREVQRDIERQVAKAEAKLRKEWELERDVADLQRDLKELSKRVDDCWEKHGIPQPIPASQVDTAPISLEAIQKKAAEMDAKKRAAQTEKWKFYGKLAAIGLGVVSLLGAFLRFVIALVEKLLEQGGFPT